MQISHIFILFLPALLNAQFLEIGSEHIEVSNNAEEGDLILTVSPIRALQNLDESVHIQIEGNPSALAVNSSIIDSDQTIQFLLVNKNAFVNGVNQVKLQALGVISGKVQEVDLTIHKSGVSSKFPTFLEPPRLLLKNEFETGETAIVKVSSDIPVESQINLYGKYSDRIRASYEGDSVILETIPCEVCVIDFPFDLLVVIRNQDQHSEHLVSFDEEKKSSLRMTQKVYRTSIEEHSGEQENLLKVTAIGNNSAIVYSLRDSTGLFSIHPKEGLLSIMHPEFLSISSFGETIELVAIATDGEITTNSKIILKIVSKIDKDVLFGFENEIYEISSSVNSKIIGNIKARSTNKLDYHVTEGREDLYKIDSDGNILYIGDVLRDDRNDLICVTVQEASGGLKMSSTYVRIELKGIGSFPINVNKAELDGIESISAEDEEGVVVSSIQFNDDDKDADLSFGLKTVQVVDQFGNNIDEDPSKYFAIKSGDDKQAHLIVSKSLSESNFTSVKFEIVGRDRTHPMEPSVSAYRTIVIERHMVTELPKSLNLLSIPKNISVPNTVPIGSFIYQAIVLPEYKDAEFRIEPEHIFQISKNGTITTRKLINDEPTNIPFRVTVSGGDLEKVEESNLKVERGELAPEHFTEQEYSMNIPRVAPIDTVVAIVTTSGPNKEGPFILRGSHSHFFNIDDEGTIKTKEDFSSSVLSDFDFLVAAAKDPSINAPVHVHLENIRTSKILLAENQLFASVYDNIPKNSFVAKIESEEKLEYKLTSENPKIEKLFNIDSDGTIRNIEYLTDFVGMYTLLVQASSIDRAGVRSTNATVVIDVLKSNECVPIFKESTIYYARETLPIDTLIGKVEAVDIDKSCELEYEVIEEDSPITVDPVNGEIRTKKEFDYEKTKTYMITLKLTAGRNNQAVQKTELRIIDENDHKVQFDQKIYTVEVSEDIAPSSTVFTAKATDKDNDGKIFYHLIDPSPPQFSLHSTKGEVRVEQNLDYENEKEYIIEIGASNSENSHEYLDKMTLVIKVNDVNDNGPTFSRDHFNTVTDKDTVVGSKILNIQAHDPDSSDKGKKLEYAITSQSFDYRGMSRNVDDVFDIHQFEGYVHSMKSLRDYVGGVFNLALSVRDVVDGTTGKTHLKIYVNDKSDLLNIELPYKPNEVTPQIVDSFISQLSNSTNLVGVPHRITYKSAHGITSTNAVDLQIIFFNETSTEIIPAERILAITEKMRGLPEIRKYQQNAISLSKPKPAPMIQPELLLIAVVFLVLLAITIVLCGLLMCYHRNKFQRQKKIVENDRAIKNAINFPATRSPALISFKHYPSPAPDMPRPIPNGEQHAYIKSPKLNENVASYAIQQATITVAENEEKI